MNIHLHFFSFSYEISEELLDIETHVAHRYHMSTMHQREYIDAHVINVWATILNNMERKRSEGSPKRFFALVDAMVNIYLFFIFTNINNQTPNDTAAKI